MNENPLLLEIKNLKTHFFLDEGIVRSVNGVDLTIRRGETLGVVGESGCGKSVTAQSILRIVPAPGRIVAGEILYHRPPRANAASPHTNPIDLVKLKPNGSEMRDIRGNEIGMVFQEPMSSLAPVYTIGAQLVETIMLHQQVSKTEARERAIDMLNRVGMPQPRQTVDSYPHQLSGGMRQRGMIAIALSCNPSLLIADEPTTALDVTTQGQILDLLCALQDELGMALMFITHDLGVIAKMADRVAVMYMGEVVEQAEVDAIFHDPRHPYTRSLLKSIPRLGRKTRRLEAIAGMVPDPYAIPNGCPFHPRCLQRIEGRCDQEKPSWLETSPGHGVRCVLYE